LYFAMVQHGIYSICPPLFILYNQKTPEKSDIFLSQNIIRLKVARRVFSPKTVLMAWGPVSISHAE